jgi:16S rRNA (uracil1498-N3)-methyltransferase
MRTHRFYTDIKLAENCLTDLPSDAAHHCAQVLRYKVDDHLILFNGDGFDYLAVVKQIDKKRCQVLISQKHDPKNESPLKIHLLQGIARGDKMDLIIQKSVELGVSEITPVFTERCNVKLDKKRLEKKMNHWNKTIVSASEQSGRAAITKLNAPVDITQLESTTEVMIYLEPTANNSIKTLNIENSISIIIGPEGGFSENDLFKLKNLKYQGVTLGPRILRTETSGLTTISILQACFGDIA